jgi:membrane-anchored protein YejM (alkaline phosphatase superfamily)
VNYYEDNGKTLDHYFYTIDEWFTRKGAKMWYLYLPHDASQKAHSFLVSGTTIIDKFKSKYGEKVKYIPNKVWINDGIQEVRKLFSRMRFDSETCVQLIRCLENYKKDYDDVKKIFRDQPRHDWASHWADNIRYFGVSDKQEAPKFVFEAFNAYE